MSHQSRQDKQPAACPRLQQAIRNQLAKRPVYRLRTRPIGCSRLPDRRNLLAWLVVTAHVPPQCLQQFFKASLGHIAVQAVLIRAFSVKPDLGN